MWGLDCVDYVTQVQYHLRICILSGFDVIQACMPTKGSIFGFQIDMMFRSQIRLFYD